MNKPPHIWKVAGRGMLLILNQGLWAGRSLAVPLRQSQGHILQELIHSDVDLGGEVCGEVHGQDQDDVVAQDL